MEINQINSDAALTHYDGAGAGLGRKLDRVRAWNRLGPEHVLGLLLGAVPAARRDALRLAGQISRSAWRIRMDAPSAGNPTGGLRELGISAGGRDYRLHISEGVRLRLEAVTQVG